jgi:Spy/CpxP family protein refolding chaperone
MKHLVRILTVALAVAAPLAARADGDGPPPKKTGLPKYYDQLSLTRDQVEKVHQVSEKYDGRIEELREKLDRLRRAPIPGGTSVILSLTKGLKKLTTERHQALIDVLTDEQKKKLKELSNPEPR